MSATSAAWAVVAAALGASVLSTGGTFFLDASRSKRRAAAAKVDELKGACVQMIANAHKFANRASALRANMIIRSGFTESLDIVLRHRQLADVLEINDYWYTELSALYDAQSIIWLSGDEVLIRGAGEIVTAVGDLMAKYSAIPKSIMDDPTDSAFEKFVRHLRKFKTFPPDPEGDLLRNDAVKQLGSVCARFGQIMRDRLGVLDVDAILRVFPGLQVVDPDDTEAPGDAVH
jgi:hypothetical protein